MLRRGKFLILPAIIVAFWAVMTTLLVEREVLVPGAPAGRAASVPRDPQDTWLGIYTSGNSRVGFLHARTAPEEREGAPGARMALQGRMQLTMLGEATDVRVDGSVWSAGDGRTSDFDFAVQSGGHDLKVEGKVAGGYLDAEVLTGGERVPLRVPMKSNPIFASGMGGLLRLPAPGPGEEFVVSTFDPMTLSTAPARVAYDRQETVNVGGKPVPSTVVRVRSSGMESKVWLGEDDTVLRAETPYGLTLARITPEEATAELEGDAGTRDLIDALAIRPTGTRPFRGAQQMEFRATGFDPSTPLPEDENQRSNGAGQYVVTAPEAPEGETGASGLENAAEHLASDPLIPADHPQIKEWARQIAGNEDTPWGVAQAIYRWVYDNIEKKPVISVPSALEVLKTRQGDCNEHTVLFTALARAAGVPTRIAIGVVWSDELGGFYYHAWPEVHVGGWVRMDPTLGQPLADATHVKIATGDILQWMRLAPFLGQLQMEVTNVR